MLPTNGCDQVQLFYSDQIQHRIDSSQLAPGCSASTSWHHWLQLCLPWMFTVTQHLHSSTDKWNRAQSVTFWERESCSEDCGPCTQHWWTGATTRPPGKQSLRHDCSWNTTCSHQQPALQVQRLAVSFVLKSNSTPSLPILPRLSTAPVSQFRILTGKLVSQCTKFYSNSRYLPAETVEYEHCFQNL